MHQIDTAGVSAPVLLTVRAVLQGDPRCVALDAGFLQISDADVTAPSAPGARASACAGRTGTPAGSALARGATQKRTAARTTARTPGCPVTRTEYVDNAP